MKTKTLKKSKSGKLKTIDKEVGNGHFRVSIFGSSRIEKNKPRYKEVQNIAKMLGERGIDIVTGGGPGLMEAASKGHKEGRKNKNIHAIGLGIKLPKEQDFNKHLDVKKEFKSFTHRLDEFMILSNAVIVAPGGVGTLLELLYTWQLAQVNHICHIPIILVGKQWPPLVKWLEKYPLKNGFIDKKDLGLLYLAKDSKEAIKMVEKTYNDFLEGGKDYCLNHKKYKI